MKTILEVDFLKNISDESATIEFTTEKELSLNLEKIYDTVVTKKKNMVGLELQIEVLIWTLLKKKAASDNRMLNYEQEIEDNLDIARFYGCDFKIPEEFRLTEVLGENYLDINGCSYDEPFSISIDLLELLLYNADNFHNIFYLNDDAIQMLYQRDDKDFSQSRYVENLAFFEFYREYLSEAFQKLKILLDDKQDLVDKKQIDNLDIILREVTRIPGINYFDGYAYNSRNDLRSISEELLDKVLANQKNQKFLRELYDWLAKYEQENLVNDYLKFIQEKGITEDISNCCIYFLKAIMEDNEDLVYFDSKVRKNTDLIFYGKEIEYKLYPELFEENVNYQKKYGFDNTDLEEKEINPEIKEYIKNNLPSNLESNLEIAIAIYILVGEILKYNPEYLISKKSPNLNKIEEISLKNNDIICCEWAMIYNSLLKEYGIKSCIAGNPEGHLWVEFCMDQMMVSADATKYGGSDYNYKLSDLANIKLGLDIRNIYVSNTYFYDDRYVDINREKLTNAINKVSKIMSKTGTTNRIDSIVDKYVNNIEKRNTIKKQHNIPLHDKKEIDYRMSTINYFYKMNYENISNDKANVERNQFFNRYFNKIFKDFDYDNISKFYLVEENNNGKQYIKRLLILKDDDGNSYYYLEEKDGFLNYNLKDLGKRIREESLQIKNSARNTGSFQKK